MAKEISSKEIKEYLEKNYLRVNVLFEIIGNPKEHVSKTITTIAKKLEEERDIVLVKGELGEPEETNDGLFGGYCEADILVKDFNKLSWLAFNFMPASIEIIEPAKLSIKDKELTDFISDLLAHLHENNTQLIQMNSLTQGLLRNMNAMVRNAILVSLLDGDKPAESIAKMIGVNPKDIEPVFEAMITEKTIEKKGSKYSRIVK